MVMTYLNDLKYSKDTSATSAQLLPQKLADHVMLNYA